MDIKSYIESGVIEAYVLGLTTAEEAAELERLRLQYAEVDEAIKDFEEEVEASATTNTVAPSAGLKEKIIQKLEINDRAAVNITSATAKVFPLWKYVAAASVILLITSAALNIYFYNQYKRSDVAYQQLLTETKSLQASNQIFNTKLNELQQSIDLVADPKVQRVVMPGAGNNQQYTATVFWNTASKKVYLLAGNLPTAPAGKQYQLWALQDGKPMDAGVMQNCTALCQMKPIEKAQAFAVTLEKEGGSPTPDLSQLYVLGNTTR